MPEGWMAAGLSAIQVANPIRIFASLNYNDEKFYVYVNPEIEYQGDAQDVKAEGCLSVPTREGPVKRFKRVRVTYYDRDGVKHREKFTAWTARVIQHEIDHLNGILFIDKLEST
jgi:peptide deformylase